LVDVAARRQAVHDLGPPAESRERKSPADDLAEDREIGGDSEPLLRAAASHPEARDHLVEDEQSARSVAEAAERRQEPVLGGNHAHVAGDGLDENRRQSLAVMRDCSRRSVDVVERAHDRVGRDDARHPRTRRQAERRNPGARTREQCVDMPVVAAGELQDSIA
jgi:hypothetical protein